MFHGNNKSTTSSQARARRTASAASSSTRSTSSTASSGSRRTAAAVARGARARHAGRRSAHARVHRDRHRGLEVRLRARQRQRARGGARASSSSRSLRFAGIHCHIGSQVFRLDSFAAAVEKMVDLVPQIEATTRRDGRRAQHRRRSRRPLSRRTTRRRRSSSTARSCTTRVDKALADVGRALAARADDRARPVDRGARRASRLYRVGTIKDIPGVRTYVAVDGGMSDNLRPVTYGARYEAFLPERGRPRSARSSSRSRASTASRATCSSATRSCPAISRSATSSRRR